MTPTLTRSPLHRLFYRIMRNYLQNSANLRALCTPVNEIELQPLAYKATFLVIYSNRNRSPLHGFNILNPARGVFA